jgi:hypothetical protein
MPTRSCYSVSLKVAKLSLQVKTKFRHSFGSIDRVGPPCLNMDHRSTLSLLLAFERVS